ncbi:MAG: iron chaperone [Gemmatimonas sp.]
MPVKRPAPKRATKKGTAKKGSARKTAAKKSAAKRSTAKRTPASPATKSSGARPTTVVAYIANAPKIGQPHLRKVRSIFRAAAPKAEELIKWGNPFYIEPRFLYAFSSFREHLSIAATRDVLEVFKDELSDIETTKEFIKIRYDAPFPTALIRKIAQYRVKVVTARTTKSFW